MLNKWHKTSIFAENMVWKSLRNHQKMHFFTSFFNGFLIKSIGIFDFATLFRGLYLSPQMELDDIQLY